LRELASGLPRAPKPEVSAADTGHREVVPGPASPGVDTGKVRLAAATGSTKAPERVVEEKKASSGKKGKKVSEDHGDSVDDWGDADAAAEAAFSDTQWFMAAIDPESLKEKPTVADLSDLQGKYTRNESIPEDVRAQFTLRKDKKGDGDKG